jgi:hypothetical protein
MIKMLLTVAVLGSAGGFAGLAMAQDQEGKAFGRDVPSVVSRLEAQCAHRRRTMPPDARDDCAAKARNDAQLNSGQGGDAAAQVAGAGAGNGGGPGGGNGLGNALGGLAGGIGGVANGIGPGSGGGQAKGRR